MKYFFWLYLFFQFQIVNAQAVYNSTFQNLTPDNPVYLMKEYGDTVFMCGDFSMIGARRPFSGVIDSLTGSVIPWSDYPNDVVKCISDDGNGGWIIGGDFTQVGGYPRSYLAQIDSAGNLTSWNPVCDNTVHTLIRKDSLLYIGGGFQNIANGSRTFLAVLNLNTMLLTSFNASLQFVSGGFVTCLEFCGDTLFAGGLFGSPVSSNYGSNLAGVNRNTGAYVSVNLPKPNSYVYAIHFDSAGHYLYAGGSFSSVFQAAISSSVSRSRVAKIDLSTNLVTSWNPILDNTCFTIEDDGISGVLLGGTFGMVGTTVLPNLALVDNNSGAVLSDPINNLGVNRYVYKLKRYGDKLFLAGEITVAAGRRTGSFIQYDLAGDSLLSWDPHVSTRQTNFCFNGQGKIGLAGEFMVVNGELRDGIAAFSKSTNQLLPWSPRIKWGKLNPGIYDMGVNDTAVFISGFLDSVDGYHRTGLACVSRLTAQVSSWNPVLYSSSGSAYTNCIEFYQGKVFIGGNFNSINSQSRPYYAAFDNYGNLLPALPSVNGKIFKILGFDNALIILGNFTVVDGQPRNKLASISLSSNAVTSWDPALSGGVSVCATDGQRIYMGGSFSQISGQPRNNFAAYDTSAVPQLLSYGSQFQSNDYINRISVDGDHVFLAGNFTQINSLPRNRLASLDRVTGGLEQWNVNCGPNQYSISCMSAIGGLAYLSGLPAYPLCDGNNFTLIAYTANGKNEITGVVYNDDNQNGVKDSLELSRPNFLVNSINGNVFTSTDSSGFFQFITDSGMYVVNTAPSPYINAIIPMSQAAYFPNWGNVDSLNNFGLVVIPAVKDLAINILPTSVIRRGGNTSHLISYRNKGTVAEDGFITVRLPSSNLYHYVNAVPLPDVVYTDSIRWNFTSLNPGEIRSIYLYGNIPTTASVGTHLDFVAVADSVIVDSIPADNYFYGSNVVVASFDPNFKIVQPTDSIQDVFSFHSDLSYVIHFQNTGSDTAINITVLDTLDTDIDLSTFVFLDHSHSCTWQIADNVLRVDFDSIMLPDSTTDFDGSQGYFAYTTYPVFPLYMNEVIHNHANIYFDYNEPILTNQVFTVFASIVTGGNSYTDDLVMKLYPNPATDKINLESNRVLSDLSVEIRDVSGRLVYKQFIDDSSKSISLPMVQNGYYLVMIKQNSALVYCNALIIQR